MSTYSILLILLYLVCLLLVLLRRFFRLKSSDALSVGFSFVTFIVASLRPKDFPDLDTYQHMFDEASQWAYYNDEFWKSHGEIGFKLLLLLLHEFGLNFDGFLLFFALLSFFLLVTISEISKTPFSYLWFSYFSFYFITRDLGILRVAIASHFIVLYFLQTKIIAKLTNLTVATFVFQHFSFVVILVDFISKFRPKLQSFALIIGLSIIIGQFIDFNLFIPFVPDKQLNTYQYSNQVQSGEGSSIFPIMRNLYFAILLYLLLKDDFAQKLSRAFVWAAILSVGTYIFSSNILLVSQRMSAYFGALLPLSYAYVLKKNELKHSAAIIVIVSLVINFIILMYHNSFVWRES